NGRRCAIANRAFDGREGEDCALGHQERPRMASQGTAWTASRAKSAYREIDSFGDCLQKGEARDGARPGASRVLWRGAHIAGNSSVSQRARHTGTGALGDVGNLRGRFLQFARRDKSWIGGTPFPKR